MSMSSALGAITYEQESSWGENVATFTTHRLPIVGAVDVSGLSHGKQTAGLVRQYRHDGTADVVMTMGGQFSITMDLPGHGTTTAGSPTVAAHETFFSKVLGDTAFSASASTTLTGGTAASPTTTASNTFSDGSMCRVGTLGDGDGDGQFYSILTHETTTLNLRGALNGAPVNGAVLYPVSMVYERDDASAVSSLRFLLQTANLQYRCHGCYPMSWEPLGLSTGERPQVRITYGVSWWTYSTATFPSTVTSTAYNPAAIAAGSLNVQDVGTTTRNARSYRNLSLVHSIGVVPLMGPGGVNQYQTVVGAVRVPGSIRISWTEDADAATSTPVLPGYGTASTMKHLEYTGSTTAGSAFGFSCPNVCIKNIATQRSDDGINRLTIEAEAYTSTTVSDSVTLAAIIYGFA